MNSTVKHMNSQQLKVETEGGSESSILFAGSTEARKLAQFRAELSSHPTTETSAAFDLARLVSSPYVDSDAFLLQFLRAENYDPKRAKERIYSHFLKKIELFGPHRLGNPVTIFELNSEDKASLLSASTVLLPDKDSLGRSILVTRYQAMKFSKAANVARAFWFLMMTVPEAELVLNGGIIWVVVSNKISGSTATRVDDAVLTELAACAKSLPMRVGELHLCTSYNEESPTRDKLTHLVSASSNIITHIHKGSPLIWIQRLVSAGVPVQRIVPLIEQTASVSNGQSSSAVAAGSSNGKLSSLGLSSDKKRDTDKAEKPISKLRKTDNIIISINHQNALVSESSEPPFSLDLLSDVTRPLKPQVQNDNLQHTSLIPQFSLTQEQMLGQSLKWGQSLMNLQSKLHGLPSVPASGVMMSNTQDTTGNMSLTPLPQDAQRTPKVQMFPTAPQSVKTTRQGLSAFPNELPLLLGSLQPPNPRATRFLLNPANIAHMLGNAHMMQMPNSAVGKQSQVSNVKNPTDLANAAVLQQTPSPQKQQPQLANGQTAKIQLDPSQTTGCGSGRTPLLLYSKLDDTALSAYQCLVRQQIEMFEATQDDVQFNISKMSKAIVHGQVGIRCRHCAILPQYSRPKAAVYYPRTLDSLYQFGQNMVKNHLCMTCKSIPEETKKTLVMLQEERRRGKGGRERWAKAAQERGAFEDKDGLRFG